MRLARLALTRFGHFTGFTLDLGPGGDTDFHVILGRNEAGKSTMVEGWLNLLYGIPMRTGYAFRHDRDTLEISAEIEDGATRHHLTRTRQGRNSPLTTATETPGEAILSGLLRGVTDDAYRNLYCLDDETIEKGGDDILASKGDLGQLLFAAASGMAAFNAELEAMRGEDRAFHIASGPGKRGTRLATLTREVREIEDRIKEIDLTAPAYRRLRDEMQQARVASDEARARHAAAIAAVEQVRTRITALPVRTELETLREQLAALGPQPDLSDAAVRDLRGLSPKHDEHLATLRTRRADHARWTAERDAIVVDPNTSALADTLAELLPLRERASTALVDLPNRHDDRDALKASTDGILADLGLEHAHLPQGALTANALDRYDSALQTLAAARQTAMAARAEHETARNAVARAERNAEVQVQDFSDPDALAALLRDTAAHTRADQLTEARRDAEDAAERARDALDALSAGGQTFTKVLDVPMTADAARQIGEQIRAGTDALTAIEARIAEDRHAVAALAGECTALAEQGTAPGDHDAAALREHRDTRWAEHRASLTPETADAFAEAMAADDRAVALRQGDTARLAELRRAERELAKTRAALAAREQTRLEILADHQAALESLRSTLAEIGLPQTLTAGDLTLWLDAHAQAVTAAQALQRAQERHAAAQDSSQPVVAALARMLQDQPDETTPSDPRETDGVAGRQTAPGAIPPDLPTLVARADRRLTALQAQRDVAETARGAVTEAHAALTTRQHAMEKADAALAIAEQTVATAAIGLGVSLPEQIDPATALPRLRKLAEQRARLIELDDRIAKMEASVAAFTEAVGAAARPWPDLADLSALAQASALDRIAEQARTQAIALEKLGVEIAGALRDIETADRERRAIEARTAEVAQAWPEGTRPQGFRPVLEAAECAQSARDLRSRIAATERQMTDLLGADSPESAEAALADATASDLRAELDLLTPELAQAEQDRDAAISAQSVAETALNSVSGDGDVAHLAQERQTLLEQIRVETETALQRRIGLMLAERALHRYREQHRGAMLAETEQAFVALTGGAYTGLSAQPTDKGDVLIAHRASDGRTLRADEATMSKGTRFQLYLALRLAGYRRMAEAGTVLPFLCDDIFETFDEQRTAAACRLLDRIGRTGQALYFTHHAHVAEIAERECPGVRIHRLDSDPAPG